MFFEQNTLEPPLAGARFLLRFSGKTEANESVSKRQLRAKKALDLMELHMSVRPYFHRRALHHRRHRPVRLRARRRRRRALTWPDIHIWRAGCSAWLPNRATSPSKTTTRRADGSRPERVVRGMGALLNPRTQVIEPAVAAQTVEQRTTIEPQLIDKADVDRLRDGVETDIRIPGETGHLGDDLMEVRLPAPTGVTDVGVFAQVIIDGVRALSARVHSELSQDPVLHAVLIVRRFARRVRRSRGCWQCRRDKRRCGRWSTTRAPW